MTQINNTRIGYYPPAAIVQLYRFETSADGQKAIVEKRDCTAEFLHTVRDWVSHNGIFQARIPNLIGRFRNWFAIRVAGRPDRAPMAVTRWFEEPDGTRYIISVTTLPKSLKV